MCPVPILAARLQNQWLAGTAATRAADVVSRLGAVQAQDFIGAKWAIGLRTTGLDDAAVEAAFDRGDILRTHVMRPTWHFVTPADIRWMLSFTAPRVHQASKSYYKKHGLDVTTLSRAHRAIASALDGGRVLSRTELAAALKRRGVDAKGPRLGLHAELEQVMCSGPVRGKQLTYALFDERAPRDRAHTPRDPGAELAARFFASHGPATLRDYVWWSGLTAAQAKTGIEHAALEARALDGAVYWSAAWGTPARVPSATFLLPNYDEYLIAYKDRSLILPPGPAPRGGIAGLNAFEHPLVVDGVLAGHWTRRMSGRTTRVELVIKATLGAAQRRAVTAAAGRLQAFSGVELSRFAEA